ncbi:MAG: cupin domain-containing protein [Thermoleophilaceae bacterium]
MADANINEPEWDRDFSEEPFRSRAMQLGPRAGAEELGASLYELDPGGAISPYHLHHGNEEMLLVLSGAPELRSPDGARRLEPGAVVAFPRGPRGAHRVSNPGEEPARIIMISTMRFPEVAEHPDTGTVLSMTGPAQGKSFPEGTDVPFRDTVMKAMEAAKRGDAG